MGPLPRFRARVHLEPEVELELPGGPLRLLPVLTCSLIRPLPRISSSGRCTNSSMYCGCRDVNIAAMTGSRGSVGWHVAYVILISSSRLGIGFSLRDDTTIRWTAPFDISSKLLTPVQNQCSKRGLYVLRQDGNHQSDSEARRTQQESKSR